MIYRASIPEMVVPYGDPGPTRYWQNYFDTGEYLVGKFANSLELGCDCLGEIAYLDATVTDDPAEPRTIPNAICIHEEDFGILWKHTDIFNGSAQSRRQRRLVVSFFSTVGNYDYGFYWYFYLDGTIECEIKLTGILFTSAYPGADHPYATEVAPGLAAPAHQHLFSARLDMMVDGLANAVEEVDVSGLPVGPDNPVRQRHGPAGDPPDPRVAGRPPGRGASGPDLAGHQHRAAQPLRPARPLHPVPGGRARPAGRPRLVAARPGRVRHQPPVGHPVRPGPPLLGRRLRQPAPGRGGPPAFIAGDHDIDGADIVLWHTFGPTHFPRTEDWPVMPVRPLRVHAQAHRLLRPQPHPRRPPVNYPPLHPRPPKDGLRNFPTMFEALPQLLAEFPLEDFAQRVAG